MSDKETWTGEDEDVEPEVRRRKKKVRVPGVWTVTVAASQKLKCPSCNLSTTVHIRLRHVFASVWFRVTLDLKHSDDENELVN